MKTLILVAIIGMGMFIVGSLGIVQSENTIPTPLPIITVTPETPTPEPTIEPTPEPTVETTPEPTTVLHVELYSFPCNDCEPYVVDSKWGYSDGTKAKLYVCPTARMLQNRAEIKQFMTYDHTQGNICLNYAEGVIRNAAYCGVEAHLGAVIFSDYSGHSFVCFPTVEDGDVWVDPTRGDWWVYVEYGRWYGVNMHNESQTYGEYIVSSISIE